MIFLPSNELELAQELAFDIQLTFKNLQAINEEIGLLIRQLDNIFNDCSS